MGRRCSAGSLGLLGSLEFLDFLDSLDSPSSFSSIILSNPLPILSNPLHKRGRTKCGPAFSLEKAPEAASRSPISPLLYHK